LESLKYKKSETLKYILPIMTRFILSPRQILYILIWPKRQVPKAELISFRVQKIRATYARCGYNMEL